MNGGVGDVQTELKNSAVPVPPPSNNVGSKPANTPSHKLHNQARQLNLMNHTILDHLHGFCGNVLRVQCEHINICGAWNRSRKESAERSNSFPLVVLPLSVPAM